jgi:hypothetical protein
MMEVVEVTGGGDGGKKGVALLNIATQTTTMIMYTCNTPQ